MTTSFVIILIINKYGNILMKIQLNGQKINIIQIIKGELCSSFFLQFYTLYATMKEPNKYHK